MNHDENGPMPGHDDAGAAPDASAAAGRRRSGLAWERRFELGPGRATLGTIRQVLFSPAAAFADMKTEGGWGEPLGFAVLMGSIGLWVAQAWDMLLRSVMAGATGLGVAEIAAANAQEIWFALAAPLLVVVSTFFGAAIVHLLLLMFGGAPRPYEATFRVFCYTWAVGVINAIPICGVFVAAVWRLVTQIIGVREAQEIPTGRAAAAVLIPVIVLCFCVLFAIMLAISVGALDPMSL